VPLPYEVWLRQTGYDYLESLDLPERQRLLVWLERLGHEPFREGDFVEAGSDGREWNVAWWQRTLSSGGWIRRSVR
jgi:hypothetical protein